MVKVVNIANLGSLERLLKGLEYDESYNSSGIYYVDEPVECILIEPDKLRPYKKVPKITTSLILNDIKLLELINNKYIPILDKNTKEVLFTEEEYFKYRNKISGIKEYCDSDFVFSENLYFDGIEYYLERIDENIKEVNNYRNPVVDYVSMVLNKHGLSVSLGCNSGGDVELVETGSTARYTNIPSDGKSKCDLDFTVRFKPELTWKVKNILENELQATGHITQTSSYKVRLTGVFIPGLDELIDLDFSLTPQTKRYLSTEDALKQKLDNIKEIDYERYKLVIANIMYAKDMLKKNGTYKPARGILDGDRSNGGLGGVGIENWILQNGGSLIDAARDFMSVADDKEFLEFEQEYFLMDFGCNHVGISKNEWPYDNFVVKNMRWLGYEKMKQVLSQFLKKQPQEVISK